MLGYLFRVACGCRVDDTHTISRCHFQSQDALLLSDLFPCVACTEPAEVGFVQGHRGLRHDGV